MEQNIGSKFDVSTVNCHEHCSLNMSKWCVPEKSTTNVAQMPWVNQLWTIADSSLWVYKFQNNFVGSSYQPSTAQKLVESYSVLKLCFLK